MSNVLVLFTFPLQCLIEYICIKPILFLFLHLSFSAHGHDVLVLWFRMNRSNLGNCETGWKGNTNRTLYLQIKQLTSLQLKSQALQKLFNLISHCQPQGVPLFFSSLFPTQQLIGLQRKRNKEERGWEKQRDARSSNQTQPQPVYSWGSYYWENHSSTLHSLPDSSSNEKEETNNPLHPHDPGYVQALLEDPRHWQMYFFHRIDSLEHMDAEQDKKFTEAE